MPLLISAHPCSFELTPVVTGTEVINCMKLSTVPVNDPTGAQSDVVPFVVSTAFANPVVASPVPPLLVASGVDNVRDVADATPRIGVTKVGLVDKTIFPVPVEVAVIANVPLVVIEEGVTFRNDGTVRPTDVTVPVPPTVIHDVDPAPFVDKTCPLIPTDVGKDKMYVPVNGGVKVTELVPELSVMFWNTVDPEATILDKLLLIDIKHIYYNGPVYPYG